MGKAFPTRTSGGAFLTRVPSGSSCLPNGASLSVRVSCVYDSHHRLGIDRCPDVCRPCSGTPRAHNRAAPALLPALRSIDPEQANALAADFDRVAVNNASATDYGPGEFPSKAGRRQGNDEGQGGDANHTRSLREPRKEKPRLGRHELPLEQRGLKNAPPLVLVGKAFPTPVSHIVRRGAENPGATAHEGVVSAECFGRGQ